MQQQLTLTLAVEDVNLILEGLGSLPYAKVYTVVAAIQKQAQQQLKDVDDDSPSETAYNVKAEKSTSKSNGKASRV